MKNTVSSSEAVGELALVYPPISKFEFSASMFLSVFEVTFVALPVVIREVNV